MERQFFFVNIVLFVRIQIILDIPRTQPTAEDLIFLSKYDLLIMSV